MCLGATDPGGCDDCKRDVVTLEESQNTSGVEEGASKTELRPALQFQFRSFGLLIVVFLYVNLAVQLVNVFGVALISYRYKKRSEVKNNRT